MYFLVDAQLSRSFCELLQGGGHQVSHVADVLSMDASGRDRIETARRLQAVIVTKDSELSQMLRHQQDNQVVWLRVGNVSKQSLAAKFAVVRAEVELRLSSADRSIEVL